MKDVGCAGQFVEQLPPHRLHTDPWLYNCFLPVDAGLTTPDEAAQSVLYSTWAFQNDDYAYGGQSRIPAHLRYHQPDAGRRR